MSASPVAYLEYDLRTIERAITKSLKGSLVERYVDLGCGSTVLTSFVSSIVKPREVVCVDIDEKALEAAKKAGFKALRCDLNNSLPLPSNYAELVTAFELLEHLWNKDQLLEEVLRVLNPGGCFIASTPNLASWAGRLSLLIGKLPPNYDVSMKYAIERPSYKHISLYTLPALTEHLRRVGFSVEEAYGLLTPWSFKNRLVRWISTSLAKIRPSLAPDLLVVAKKAA
ncbi:MAG: class I SAM-dependent methyltransferase [Candidatus Nezhaarchaeota archaeon]|nr:class I SAM-dependent methyltransferase [Candidatus Nezhaarchaeota archaeon]